MMVSMMICDIKLNEDIIAHNISFYLVIMSLPTIYVLQVDDSWSHSNKKEEIYFHIFKTISQINIYHYNLSLYLSL